MTSAVSITKADSRSPHGAGPLQLWWLERALRATERFAAGVVLLLCRRSSRRPARASRRHLAVMEPRLASNDRLLLSPRPHAKSAPRCHRLGGEASIRRAARRSIGVRHTLPATGCSRRPFAAAPDQRDRLSRSSRRSTTSMASRSACAGWSMPQARRSPAASSASGAAADDGVVRIAPRCRVAAVLSRLRVERA